MIYRALVTAIVIAAITALPGCKKQQPAAPADTAQQVQEQAEQADTSQQAQEPVTEENLKQQVDNMEEEIQEDIAAEE